MQLKLIKNNDYLFKIFSTKKRIKNKRYSNEKYFVVSKDNLILGIVRIINQNYFETWFIDNNSSKFFFENFNFKEELDLKLN